MNEDIPYTATSTWWCGNCSVAVLSDGFCHNNNWNPGWINHIACNGSKKY